MITRRLSNLVLLALLLLCMVGCNGGEEPLLEDHFSDPRSGWGSDSQDAFDRGYEEGEYFIEVYEESWFTWAPSGNRFRDVDVAVEARPIALSSDGHFGLLCRYRAPDNFYYLGVTQDGYYAIIRVDGDKVDILTGEGFTYSPAILPRGGKYLLRAVCAGDEISLYVSNTLIATVNDATFDRGDVAVGVGSSPLESIRVHFDDLVVVAPEASE